MAFPNIEISIEGKGLRASVYYKPTDPHSYLLYSSSHPSHVKNSIPFSQFLRPRRLCSDDSDFSEKSEVMCQFFDKRGYPVSVVQAGHHRAQQIDTRHYNRLRRKTLIAFHSISHFTLTTTQLDLTFFKTLELDGDHRFTFLTELLTLIYLSYSPTDAASQFLWKLSPLEGTFFLGGGEGWVLRGEGHQ